MPVENVNSIITQNLTIYSFYFDICALALSVLVSIYIVRVRSLGTFRNRVFFMYIITVCIICILELMQAFPLLDMNHQRSTVDLIFDCLAYSFIIFVPVVFLIYIFALVDYFQMMPEEHKSMLPFRIYFPISLSLFLIWISPLTGNRITMFSYLDSLTPLKEGRLGYLLLFIIGYYYIAFGLITMFRHKHRLEKQVAFQMIYFFFVLNIAVIVQYYFKVRLASFAFAISTVQFSLFIQKPEFLTNSKTDIMNSRAFDIIVSDYIVHKYNFKVILLCPQSSEFYRYYIGQNELAELESCIIRRVRGKFRDEIFLKDEVHGFYYLLFKNTSDTQMESNINFVNEQIKDRWGYRGLKFDFSFKVCIIDGLKDITSVDELRNISIVFSRMDQYKGMCVNAADIDFSHMRSCIRVEQAIKSGDLDKLFTVEYQPVFSVAQKKITRAETVLHFNGEDDMYVTTDSFITVFEKTNQFLNINAIAFNAVCEMLSSVDIFSLGLEKIGVKVSVLDCSMQDFYTQIKNRIDFYKVFPTSIYLEVTQTSYTDFPDMIVKNLQNLAEYGTEIVFDNFGLDNSNMQQFVTLSLGMIKLDAKVVESAWANSSIGVALKSIISTAHELGVQVAANGVETMEQQIWLEGIGCDYLQGNLFSKPLPEADFIRYLQEKPNI